MLQQCAVLYVVYYAPACRFEQFNITRNYMQTQAEQLHMQNKHIAVDVDAGMHPTTPNQKPSTGKTTTTLGANGDDATALGN